MKIGDKYVYLYKRKGEKKTTKYPVEVFKLGLSMDISGRVELEVDIVRSDNYDAGFPEMTPDREIYLLNRVTITDIENLVPVKK